MDFAISGQFVMIRFLLIMPQLIRLDSIFKEISKPVLSSFQFYLNIIIDDDKPIWHIGREP